MQHHGFADLPAPSEMEEGTLERTWRWLGAAHPLGHVLTRNTTRQTTSTVSAEVGVISTPACLAPCLILRRYKIEALLPRWTKAFPDSRDDDEHDVPACGAPHNTVNNHLPTPHTPFFHHLSQPSRDGYNPSACKTEKPNLVDSGGGTLRLDFHFNVSKVGSQTRHLQFQRAGFAQKFDIDIFRGSVPNPGSIPPRVYRTSSGIASQIRFFNASSVEFFCFFFCLPPTGSSARGRRVSEQQPWNVPPRETVLL